MRLAVLGSGQLAQMLIEAFARLRPGAEKLGILGAYDGPGVPALLPESTQIGPGALELKVYPPSQLSTLLGAAEKVIFENEFVDVAELEAATRLAGRDPHTLFVPRLQVIRTLQNKVFQKEMLSRLGIPTSRWIEWDPAQGAASVFIDRCEREFSGGSVLKWAELGYDGKGTLISSDRSARVEFLESALAHGRRVFAEARVSFTRELAIVACRGAGGVVTYPLVISDQEGATCRWVRGPATAFGVHPSLELGARSFAEKIAKDLDLIGAFALEFFETSEGLVVNEIAPRVHNTGHYSQDACRVSQFEQHVRAALGLELEAPMPAPFFAMLNLLGPRGAKLEGDLSDRLPEAPPGCAVHWYFKLGSQPGRKLGHVNLSAGTREEFERGFTALGEYLQKWETQLLR